MLVFRWIVGVFAALLAIGSIASFALFLSFDIPLWLGRARRLRHWLWVVALVWFNVEVWGRVVLTLVRWK